MCPPNSCLKSANSWPSSATERSGSHAGARNSSNQHKIEVIDFRLRFLIGNRLALHEAGSLKRSDSALREEFIIAEKLK